MSRLFIKSLLISAALVLPIGNCLASVVQAKGSAAVVNADVATARKLALKDAMSQAMLQGGASVQSDTRMDLSVLQSDSVRVRANGNVTDVVILDEWLDEDHDIYYTHIRARVEPADEAQKRREAIRYRKKLAVAQFSVLDRYQIHDMPNIEVALAKEFLGRLEAKANLLSVDASQYLLPLSSQQLQATGNSPTQVITQLAQTLGVQFIMDGRILDLGETDHTLGINVRHVELELTLYDGLNGAVLSKFRDAGSIVQGRLLDFPLTTPSANAKFFASQVGQEINKVLNHLVDRVANFLADMPFTARVVKADGNKVFFDVGSLANVNVGDVFMTYRVSAEPLQGSTPSMHLGFAESPLASLVVRRVQPMFAMGEVESKQLALKVGDVVRFSW